MALYFLPYINIWVHIFYLKSIRFNRIVLKWFSRSYCVSFSFFEICFFVVFYSVILYIFYVFELSNISLCIIMHINIFLIVGTFIFYIPYSSLKVIFHIWTFLSPSMYKFIYKLKLLCRLDRASKKIILYFVFSLYSRNL